LFVISLKIRLKSSLRDLYDGFSTYNTDAHLDITVMN